MQASIATITTDQGMSLTKNNKNVPQFLSDFSFRQGKITDRFEGGYVADLHSGVWLQDETVVGRIEVFI